jgi:hypothetical protein
MRSLVLKRKAVTPVECLLQAMTLLTSVVITGIDGMEILTPDLEVVKTWLVEPAKGPSDGRPNQPSGNGQHGFGGHEFQPQGGEIIESLEAKNAAIFRNERFRRVLDPPVWVVTRPPASRSYYRMAGRGGAANSSGRASGCERRP